MAGCPGEPIVRDRRGASFSRHSITVTASAADLRATSARYPNDPDVAALISRMAGNDRFRHLWALRAVASHESAHKTAVHPDVGAIPLDANVLTTQNTDLRLVVRTPRPDTGAREKLDRLG